MKISQGTANRIVTELSHIIDQNINLMDEQGVIISSTNPKRIGTFHGGSLKIIHEHLKELIIYKDDEPEGSKKGLNLPVEMEGKCVGVIGITGEYEEVKKYGYIIKKMTEILLLEDELHEQKRLEKSVRARFVREWLLNGADVRDPSFREQAAGLDINLNASWRILVLTTIGASVTDSIGRLRKIEQIEAAMAAMFSKTTEYLFLSNGNKYILLIPEPGEMELRHLCSELFKTVQKIENIELRIGVDSTAVEAEDARNSYLRAERALKAAVKSGKREPVFYDELDLELIIHELPEGVMREYVARVFRGCSREEIQNARTLLKTLFACNGSICKAGEKLFLHKNTLQYQLNRLWQKTGINPRSIHGATLYDLALAFLEEEDI